MTLPVAPLRLPADLKHESNGEISQSLLTLCGIGNFRMHHLASRAMRALIAAYPPFTETSTGTYRTYAQQVTLFSQRYTTNRIPGRPTKVWNGQTWWQLPGVAMAAVPGTSNHGLGLAIDFAEQLDGDPAPESISAEFVAWLCQNAATYGYSAETQSEAWHWRYVAGDQVPAAVIEFENNDPPLEDDDMSAARLVKHTRYQNIWLVGAGPALALSGELYASYKDTIPLITSDHPQLLESLLVQSGLQLGDLVPV